MRHVPWKCESVLLCVEREKKKPKTLTVEGLVISPSVMVISHHRNEHKIQHSVLWSLQPLTTTEHEYSSQVSFTNKQRSRKSARNYFCASAVQVVFRQAA